MVKVHLWKSELAICISSIEFGIKKTNPTGVELELIKDVLRKLTKAYNSAQR